MNKFVDECVMMPWKNKKMKLEIRSRRENILQRAVSKALLRELEKIGNVEKVSFTYDKNIQRCTCCGFDEDCGMKSYEHICIFFGEGNKIDLISYLGEILLIYNDQTCYPEIFSFFDVKDVDMSFYAISNKKFVEVCVLSIGEKLFEWKNYMIRDKVFEKFDEIKHELFECYDRIKYNYENYPIHYTQKICLLLLASHRFDKQSVFAHIPLDMARLIAQIVWNSRYDNF